MNKKDKIKKKYGIDHGMEPSSNILRKTTKLNVTICDLFYTQDIKEVLFNSNFHSRNLFLIVQCTMNRTQDSKFWTVRIPVLMIKNRMRKITYKALKLGRVLPYVSVCCFCCLNIFIVSVGNSKQNYRIKFNYYPTPRSIKQ